MDRVAGPPTTTVLDRMPDAYAEVGAGEIVRYANAGVERVLGIPRSELIGVTLSEALTEAFADAFRTALSSDQARSAEGEAVQFETFYAPRDAWLRVSVSPSEDGFSLFFRDVTERRRSLLEAAETEAKYKTLVEHLPLIVYVDELDDSSSNLYSSPQSQQLLGYTAQEWQEDKDLFPKTLHPEDKERVLAEHHESNLSGEALRTEYRLLAKDGRVVWIRDESVVVRDADGTPLFRQGFMLDLTRSKETESALRDAERRYRTLVEQAPLGIYRNSPTGELLYVSPQVEQLCGFAAEEFMTDQNLFWATLHPDDLDLVRRETKRAIATESDFRLEYRIVARDGSVVWILDRASAVRGVDGRTLYRQGFIVDVTADKAREEAFRVSEERFRRSFDNAPIGMALVSLEGRWLLVNPALCDIVGYSEAELLGMTFQDITHADDLEDDLDKMYLLLDGEIRWYQMEKRYIHKEGHEVWVLLSVSLVQDAAGNPLHFISQIQDVTERRRLEEELRQSQKMEAVGRLAGGVAHDFNNLLTAISGYSELLMARHREDDRDHRDAEQIKRAAARAAQLTAQLLAFSRRQVLQPQVFRFDEAVGEMQELLGRLIPESVAVRTALAAGQAHVRADRTQIEQVVVNLAVNARDAMPGGGTLTIETTVVELPDPTLPEAELPPGSYALLTVADTGEGMDAGTREQVFEPFFTTKPLGDGTGLGLATVYGTVKQSGGDIVVSSAVGSGTTFRVFLPLAAAPLESLPEPVDERSAEGSETVLLAEDEDVVRALVCEILRGRGYAVLEAAHPEEALRLSHDHEGSIHILVTDIVMPGMSGHALAERLSRERPGLRVLYTSGYTNGRIPSGDALGPDAAFIQKPFSADALAAKVREILDEARAAA